MKFNTKTRYGIRTMLEIALKQDQEGIFQKEISKSQKISFKYLDQIVSALKTAKLITNVKGKKSGYILTRSAEKIAMYDILRAFEPEICIVDCLSENVHCPDENYCAPRDFWLDLNTLIADYFSQYTLKDLVERQRAYNSHSRDDSKQQDNV
ncbi:MAG: RrF2 family transcriptional regulator [Bacteroidales bacterium]